MSADLPPYNADHEVLKALGILQRRLLGMVEIGNLLEVADRSGSLISPAADAMSHVMATVGIGGAIAQRGAYEQLAVVAIAGMIECSLRAEQEVAG